MVCKRLRSTITHIVVGVTANKALIDVAVEATPSNHGADEIAARLSNCP